MKRIAALLLIIPFLISQGCAFPQSYAIEKTQRILIAGIDTDGEEIVLTALVDTTEGTKPGEEKIAYKLYTAKGKTVSEAENMLATLAERRVAWHHAKYVLVGEDAAKEDINRLFSFFVEGDETRLLFRLAVTKGMAAGEFLKKASTIKGGLPAYLDTLFAGAARTGMTREIHLINYAAYSEIPWVSVYIPALELSENPAAKDKGQKQGGGEGEGGSSEEQESLVRAQGFALFSGGKLAGYLDGMQARALNLLNNELKGGQVSVKDKGGGSASLELAQAHAELKPSFEPLSLEISVDIKSILAEYLGADPLKEEDSEYLEQQLNETICSEIAGAISEMQRLRCDPAFIMDKFYHKDPVKWQGIKDDWKKIFTGLKVSISVNSNIIQTYDMAEALGGGGD